MKLATIRDGSPDGQLVVVSKDLSKMVHAASIAATMQAALDNWADVDDALQKLYDALNNNQLTDALDFDPSQAMAPLARSWQWLDGSSFLAHSRRMQIAYHQEPIADLETIPLMYQGAGDGFLGPQDDIVLPNEAHGIDFEGEFAVLLDSVPMGCSAEAARQHIKLVVQLNDVSLRVLAPREMKTGFGFVQSKVQTSFAPVAVTPDELGSAWQDQRVNLSLKVEWNGDWFGNPSASQMHFGFDQLIAHAALARGLEAGTVIGSGTVSNSDTKVGAACISERRAVEIIESGEPKTSFMSFGDRIKMQALDQHGNSPFGAIDQQVKAFGEQQ